MAFNPLTPFRRTESIPRDELGRFQEKPDIRKIVTIAFILAFVGIGLVYSHVKATDRVAEQGGGNEQVEMTLVPTGTQYAVHGNVVFAPYEGDPDVPAVYLGDDAKTLYKWLEWERSEARKNLPKFTAKVTAYNSVPEQTDSTPCIAANGSNICELRKRGVQTCAAALPFGMKLSVPGFGECIVVDRLAPKYANRIDLYMGGRDEVAKARAWGSKTLQVTVLP